MFDAAVSINMCLNSHHILKELLEMTFLIVQTLTSGEHIIQNCSIPYLNNAENPHLIFPLQSSSVYVLFFINAVTETSKQIIVTGQHVYIHKCKIHQ